MGTNYKKDMRFLFLLQMNSIFTNEMKRRNEFFLNLKKKIDTYFIME